MHYYVTPGIYCTVESSYELYEHDVGDYCEEAWRAGKGIVGIYVHNLKDILGNQSTKGNNPFRAFYIDKTYTYIAKRDNKADDNEILLSSVCHAYDPPYVMSTNVYKYISENIEDWVEEAIRIRKMYP